MSEKLNRAIAFATNAHNGQMRKMEAIPYIIHPMEVATIIASITDNEDLMIAGLLHDTIEDCDVLAEEITEAFGSHVSALVQGESEDKLSDRPPEETWMQRKEESLLLLEHSKNREVKILWLADKLANMRSFYRSYRKIGDEVWSHLHQKDPKMQGWYYKTIARCLESELGGSAAYEEYVGLVNKVFGED